MNNSPWKGGVAFEYIHAYLLHKLQAFLLLLQQKWIFQRCKPFITLSIAQYLKIILPIRTLRYKKLPSTNNSPHYYHLISSNAWHNCPHLLFFYCRPTNLRYQKLLLATSGAYLIIHWGCLGMIPRPWWLMLLECNGGKK